MSAETQLTNTASTYCQVSQHYMPGAKLSHEDILKVFMKEVKATTHGSTTVVV